jgi:hypothetical protein
MLYFRLGLPSHWSKNNKHFFCFEEPIKNWAHKNYTIQLSYFGWTNLFDLEIDFGLEHTDHRGPKFEITILGLMFNIAIYDSRHWDYDADTYCVYGEEND